VSSRHARVVRAEQVMPYQPGRAINWPRAWPRGGHHRTRGSARTGRKRPRVRADALSMN